MYLEPKFDKRAKLSVSLTNFSGSQAFAEMNALNILGPWKNGPYSHFNNNRGSASTSFERSSGTSSLTLLETTCTFPPRVPARPSHPPRQHRRGMKGSDKQRVETNPLASWGGLSAEYKCSSAQPPAAVALPRLHSHLLQIILLP